MQFPLTNQDLNTLLGGTMKEMKAALTEHGVRVSPGTRRPALCEMVREAQRKAEEKAARTKTYAIQEAAHEALGIPSMTDLMRCEFQTAGEESGDADVIEDSIWRMANMFSTLRQAFMLINSIMSICQTVRTLEAEVGQTVTVTVDGEVTEFEVTEEMVELERARLYRVI